MSSVRYYHLKCDHPRCAATICTNLDRADATRAQAVMVGWVHGVSPPNQSTGWPAKSLDYCPGHARDIGDLRPKTLPAHARPS